MTQARPETSKISAPSLRDALISCVESGQGRHLLEGLRGGDLVWFLTDWLLFARPDQLPPETARGGGDWSTWLVLGGRGAGKTRTGAEWVRGLALGRPPFAARPVGRIAIIGETMQDLREVMVEGVSGLRAIHPPAERPVWHASRRRLEWPNGAVAQGFSAEDPESLRGPQFEAAWCDELAKWPHAAEAFDMLQFGLRLGARPRQVITTTPRPTPLLKRLAADPRTALSHAPTRANAANLAPNFLAEIVGRYAGTALGRQELDGLFIEERPDALFRREAIEAGRCASPPALARIVVAVDPPAGGRRGGRCGIIVAGRDAAGLVYVVEDASLESAPPERWAARAIEAYRRHEADALVAEINQGGAMVASVLGAVDAAVPVTPVRARRGKHVRAEPVAALYAQGRVRHAGCFPALEDEMVAFGPDGLAEGRSPDRLDALVWAVTHLALDGEAGAPRVRRLIG
ncbi:DNA-packaging protein [Rhabdaerophilum calidifontis]|uniref:DNA-packaging protein n=1 Tax=Rhabdaerophilum calidifontis TaxID=2604328 RepID=UPI00123A4AD0|nr:terminase family protein [Rhabdaerophilum calidifontis]